MGKENKGEASSTLVGSVFAKQKAEKKLSLIGRISKIEALLNEIEYSLKEVRASENLVILENAKKENEPRLIELEKSLERIYSDDDVPKTHRLTIVPFYAEIVVRLKRSNAKQIFESGLQEFPNDSKLLFLQAFLKRDNESLDLLKESLWQQELEREEYRKRYELAQRFANRMIHKIGNAAFMLNGIVKNAELRADPGQPSKTLQQFKEGVSNLQSLIRELKLLESNTTSQHHYFELLPIIKMATSSVEAKTESVSIQIEPEDLCIRGKPEHFLQTLGELLENAVIKNQKNLKLKITAERVPLPETVSLDIKEVKEVVQLIVEDDGHGIDEKYKESIFEPFFSLAQGSGLGLALVKKTVEEEHHGWIRETGQFGEGARFELFFPCYPEDDA